MPSNWTELSADTVWSKYAATGNKVEEYWAEGVTYHKQSEETRAELKAKDPEFFAYLSDQKI